MVSDVTKKFQEGEPFDNIKETLSEFNDLEKEVNEIANSNVFRRAFSVKRKKELVDRVKDLAKSNALFATEEVRNRLSKILSLLPFSKADQVSIEYKINDANRIESSIKELSRVSEAHLCRLCNIGRSSDMRVLRDIFQNFVDTETRLENLNRENPHLKHRREIYGQIQLRLGYLLILHASPMRENNVDTIRKFYIADKITERRFNSLLSAFFPHIESEEKKSRQQQQSRKAVDTFFFQQLDLHLKKANPEYHARLLLLLTTPADKKEAIRRPRFVAIFNQDLERKLRIKARIEGLFKAAYVGKKLSTLASKLTQKSLLKAEDKEREGKAKAAHKQFLQERPQQVAAYNLIVKEIMPEIAKSAFSADGKLTQWYKVSEADFFGSHPEKYPSNLRKVAEDKEKLASSASSKEEKAKMLAEAVAYRKEANKNEKEMRAFAEKELIIDSVVQEDWFRDATSADNMPTLFYHGMSDEMAELVRKQKGFDPAGPSGRQLDSGSGIYLAPKKDEAAMYAHAAHGTDQGIVRAEIRLQKVAMVCARVSGLLWELSDVFNALSWKGLDLIRKKFSTADVLLQHKYRIYLENALFAQYFKNRGYQGVYRPYSDRAMCGYINVFNPEDKRRVRILSDIPTVPPPLQNIPMSYGARKAIRELLKDGSPTSLGVARDVFNAARKLHEARLSRNPHRISRAQKELDNFLRSV